MGHRCTSGLASLRISDLSAPDLGEKVEAYDGDVPVFWHHRHP